MEFISEFRPPLLMQSLHPLFLSQVTANFNSGRRMCFFLTMTSIWKLFYYSPKEAESLKGIQAVLGFPVLKIVKPFYTRWLSHEHCVRQFARNCLHCCKPFHSYMSHQEMLRHMVYIPFWLLLMVYQAVILYQKFSVPLLY